MYLILYAIDTLTLNGIIYNLLFYMSCLCHIYLVNFTLANGNAVL